MARPLMLAAAQLGPIQRGTPRAEAVARLVLLLERAADMGCSLAVFPEMALTTFFPRRLIDEGPELASCFDRQMPGPETAPLFETAQRRGIGFYLGYCEETPDGTRYNTAIPTDERGAIIGKYRKVHLPGNPKYDPALKLQHLEPWYFTPGDLGFPVFDMLGGRLGMLLCNDRRWPEAHRMLGLKGVELICLGYNSPAQLPDNPAQNALRKLHHLMPMQAAAYQNGTWIVAAAKAGHEDGCDMMGHSCVIAPSGEVVALSSTLEDELVPYCIDLDATAEYKRFFDFATYRRPECYGPIAGYPEGTDA